MDDERKKTFLFKAFDSWTICILRGEPAFPETYAIILVIFIFVIKCEMLVTNFSKNYNINILDMLSVQHISLGLHW